MRLFRGLVLWLGPLASVGEAQMLGHCSSDGLLFLSTPPCPPAKVSFARRGGDLWLQGRNPRDHQRRDTECSVVVLEGIPGDRVPPIWVPTVGIELQGVVHGGLA